MAAEVHDAAAGMRGDRREIQQLRAGLIVSLDTADFDTFRAAALGWVLEHQWIGARKPHTTLSAVMTPSLQIGLVQHSMGYGSQGRNPQGTLTMAVPLDESALMIHRGRSIGRMDSGLLRNSDGFELACPHGARFLLVSVSEARAERFAADVRQEPHVWRHAADRLRFSNPACRLRFIDRCRNALAAVAAQPRLLDDPSSATLFEEELLETLLLEVCIEPQSCGERNRYKVARQAYRYLQDRIDDVPSIGELCAITGASYATLERGFRELYGMAPRGMINQLRLFRARTALLNPSPSTTVTGVALRWGYLEFGRFSAHYRRRFGEAPRETLRRTRGESSRLGESNSGYPALGNWLAGHSFGPALAMPA